MKFSFTVETVAAAGAAVAGIAVMYRLYKRNAGLPSQPSPCADRDVSGQTEEAAAKPKIDVSSLYPSKLAVLRHAVIHALRVGIIATASTLLLEPYFLRLVDVMNLSDKHFFVVVSSALFTLSAAIPAGFFWACDRFKWFQQYKIERTERMKSPPGLERRTLYRVLFFHVFSIGFMYAMWELEPYKPARAPLPSTWVIFREFVSGLLINFELSGYLVHLLQHHFDWLYRASHKMHHEYIATISIAAEYVTFAEILAGSAGSYSQFQQYHMLMYLLYIVWRVADTYEVHSGYSFRGTWLSRIGLLNSNRAEFHDYHHSHNNGNYGENIFMDFLFHTCDGWVLHLHQQGRSVI